MLINEYICHLCNRMKTYIILTRGRSFIVGIGWLEDTDMAVHFQVSFKKLHLHVSHIQCSVLDQFMHSMSLKDKIAPIINIVYPPARMHVTKTTKFTLSYHVTNIQTLVIASMNDNTKGIWMSLLSVLSNTYLHDILCLCLMNKAPFIPCKG